MARYLWMVQQESSDPAKDAEIREWLDKVHVPDLLKIPEVVRCTLYGNVGPQLDVPDLVQDIGISPNLNPPRTGWHKGQARYVAIYEIETDDIDKAWTKIRNWIEENHRTRPGWRNPLLKVISRSVWQQLTPHKVRHPGK
ncbi:MAG: hypothetical protein HYX92_03470 [Chloroflexi bacterium]|nr:hypothetical protein [Chloroflexota bacterium]